MKKTIFTFLTVTVLLFHACNETAKEGDGVYEADVIVYGGTSAAVTAAVQVSRMGKSVIVVSPDQHLGGLSSGD